MNKIQPVAPIPYFIQDFLPFYELLYNMVAIKDLNDFKIHFELNCKKIKIQDNARESINLQ